MLLLIALLRKSHSLPLTRPPFRVHGTKGKIALRKISTSSARKLLNKGCEGYLAFLAEGEKERPKPEDMVNELSDAFQEDLPGLHPLFFLLFLARERRILQQRQESEEDGEIE